MNRRYVLAMAIVAQAFGLVAVSAQQPAVPGNALRKGMKLVYGSGGNEQPAWVVDSLDLRATFGGRESCSYIRFGANDVRRACVSGDTLYNWSEAAGRLVAARPLGAHQSLRVTRPDGSYSEFTTQAWETATVGSRSFRALPTIVTTHRADGTTTRRLRERYVLALATALGGIFEVPDPQSPGNWLVQQEFTLVRIEGAEKAGVGAGAELQRRQLPN